MYLCFETQRFGNQKEGGSPEGGVSLYPQKVSPWKVVAGVFLAQPEWLLLSFLDKMPVCPPTFPFQWLSFVSNSITGKPFVNTKNCLFIVCMWFSAHCTRLQFSRVRPVFEWTLASLVMAVVTCGCEDADTQLAQLISDIMYYAPSTLSLCSALSHGASQASEPTESAEIFLNVDSDSVHLGWVE